MTLVLEFGPVNGINVVHAHISLFLKKDNNLNNFYNIPITKHMLYYLHVYN